MSEIDITQYRTNEDDFVKLGETHPQGAYEICVGEGRRTTWFRMVIPINKILTNFTWHLDQWPMNEDEFTKLCKHINKRYDTTNEDNEHYILGDR